MGFCCYQIRTLLRGSILSLNLTTLPKSSRNRFEICNTCSTRKERLPFGSRFLRTGRTQNHLVQTDAASESNGSSLTLPSRQEEKTREARISPPPATTQPSSCLIRGSAPNVPRRLMSLASSLRSDQDRRFALKRSWIFYCDQYAQQTYTCRILTGKTNRPGSRRTK